MLLDSLNVNPRRDKHNHSTQKRANERIETCEPWPCDTTDRFCDDSPQLFIAFGKVK